jgi:hypothetical protein
MNTTIPKIGATMRPSSSRRCFRLARWVDSSAAAARLAAAASAGAAG